MNAEKPEFSGRVKLRIPATLHRDLARAARAEGVSLNQFSCAALAVAVSWRGPPAAQSAKRNACPRGPGDEAFTQIWSKLLA
jgi:HicB-like protein involved in pilus formation